jgi:hypothetical protein
MAEMIEVTVIVTHPEAAPGSEAYLHGRVGGEGARGRGWRGGHRRRAAVRRSVAGWRGGGEGWRGGHHGATRCHCVIETRQPLGGGGDAPAGQQIMFGHRLRPADGRQADEAGY